MTHHYAQSSLKKIEDSLSALSSIDFWIQQDF